jgi:Tfp pilus assembly protein PilX
MKIQDKNKNRNERGVALVAVMLTLLLVTAMAAAIIILANTETNTSANFKDEQRAFFAAKAGIEEARDRLVTSYTTSGYVLTTLPTTLPGSGTTGVLYITNPLGSETVAPWCGNSNPISSSCANQYPDDELCNETLGGVSVTCTTDTTTGKKYPSGSYYLTSVSASNTLKPTSGPVLDWKWVRITLKQNNGFGASYAVNGNSATTSQIYWNGNNECVQTVANAGVCKLPVYVITALAVTPSGSRRMVQMEAARDQFDFNAPAALTMDGTSDSFAGGNSNNFTVTGIDQGGCGTSQPTTPTKVAAVGVSTGAQGTPNTGEVATVINGIPNGRMDMYTGSSGNTPDVQNISSTLASGINLNYDLSTVTGLQNFASSVKTAVTQPVMNCTSGCSSLSNYGSVGNPQIVYVNGDLTLTGNSTGYGILVVTGNLVLKGTVAWNGLVLVIGKGSLEMNGNNTITGAAIIAQTLNPTTGALRTTIGSPTYNVSGGGNQQGGVFYSASCLATGTQLTTYHSVSFRELMN